jgi:hypothetical protein
MCIFLFLRAQRAGHACALRSGVVGQLSPDSRRIDAALPDLADIPFISIRLFALPFR